MKVAVFYPRRSNNNLLRSREAAEFSLPPALSVLPLLQAMKSGMNPGHMTIRLLKSTSASPAALAKTVTLLPKWPEDTRRNVDDEQNAVMPLLMYLLAWQEHSFSEASRRVVSRSDEPPNWTKSVSHPPWHLGAS